MVDIMLVLPEWSLNQKSRLKNLRQHLQLLRRKTIPMEKHPHREIWDLVLLVILLNQSSGH
jgi:hypothetical protein